MEKDLIFLDLAKKKDDSFIRELSSLSLAFIGDAVYELMVRTYILDGNQNVNKLHRKAINFVKAKAQADSINSIIDQLTKEELSVFRRGRNTNPHTVPKNAKLSDYRAATGLEAVFGYLYLKNDADRLMELFNMMEEKRNES
jgi:ribonuclease-3 family protein